MFEDAPEFYAQYKLLNVRNHHIYNDKFNLSVVDLSRIDLATDEDRLYQIDKWARLFKSQTWEELKMLAENNPDISSAVSTIYQASQDSRIEEQCRIREEYYARQRYMKEKMERLAQVEADLENAQTTLSGIEAELDRKNSELAKKNSEIAAKDSEIAAKDSEIAARDSEIAARDSEIAARDDLIRELQTKLKETEK